MLDRAIGWVASRDQLMINPRLPLGDRDWNRASVLEDRLEL